jgi:hypothetical protein
MCWFRKKEIALIYQTDQDFNTITNHEGCCLFTTAYLICRQFDIPFIAPAMQTWIKRNYDDGDITEGDFLRNPQGFVDDICGKGKVEYLGILKSDYIKEPSVLVSDYLFNQQSGYRHFVVGWTGPVASGHPIEYDPINTPNNFGINGSNTASAPQTIIESKRGFRVIG